MADNVFVPPAERLRRIAAALEGGEASPTPTVREFLSWFNAMRRGGWIVQRIRRQLKEHRLTTQPDFESAYIDSQISIQPIVNESVTVAVPTGQLTVAGVPPTNETPVDTFSPVTVGIADPTYRLSKLGAANNPPLSVSPDQSIVDAVTLMLSYDYSQLPVMTSERHVKGVVSWRSIGARWALDREGSYVRDFMDNVAEISADRSIFEALPLIVERDYVLVRDASSKISGIVTTSDLSLQFQQLAEPFLLLGEIENQVRRLIDGKFSKQELGAAKDPGDADRVVDSVSDLTFGEYLRLLQDPARWSKLNLSIERSLFVKDLEAVRLIRNDVMHFDPDPLPDEDLVRLRRFAKFLRAIQKLGQ